MISPDELAYIYKKAYIPEHLPHYVNAIFETEAFLVGDFIVHVSGTSAVFVGYPLSGHFEEQEMLSALAKVRSRFDPDLVSVLAPEMPASLGPCPPHPRDEYYRLDLSRLEIPKKTRNMLSRARREVTVSHGNFSRQHRRLVDTFLRTHSLDRASQSIFRNLAGYTKCNTALVFEARNSRGDLAAFDVADFGAQEYGFYMFNFRSNRHSVPGASDLLLAHIIEHAQAEGKRYINLGLGIDAGVTFFKQKWGAVPFLKHIAVIQEYRPQEPWSAVFERFSKL